MRKLMMVALAALFAAPAMATQDAGPPSRELPFGYHRVVGRAQDLTAEVDHTDIVYYGTFNDIFTEVPPQERPEEVRAGMAAIKAAGKRAVVNLQVNRNGGLLTEEQIYKAILDADAGAIVAYLLLADEVEWPTDYASDRAAQTRALWAVQFPELPAPPVGVTVTPSVGSHADFVRDSNLDFINVQGYMESCQCAGPCCCGSDPEAATKEVLGVLDAQAAHIPLSKFLLVTMQAYTRNGHFCPVEPGLVDVQRVTYEWALESPRVRAVVGFAWDRGAWDNPIGTRYQPALEAEHRRLRFGEGPPPAAAGQPETGPSFRKLLAIYGVGALGDGISTEWFRVSGGREALNTWHGGTAGVVAVQAAFTVSMAAADRYLLQRGSPRIARVARIVALVAKGLLTINNGIYAATGRSLFH